MSQIKRLQLAKRTLQNTDVPFQIRVLSYLRLSCFTFDEQGGRYSKLTKALFNYDSNWWTTCYITPQGELRSNDPVINELLRPVEEFHQSKVLSMAS